MALALALLASAGALAATLPPTADTPLPFAGVPVPLRGPMTPFEVPATPAWAPVAALLDKVTYALAAGPDATVLVTAATPAPPGGDAVGQGFVLWQGAHPDDPARVLVLLQGAWQPRLR